MKSLFGQLGPPSKSQVSQWKRIKLLFSLFCTLGFAIIGTQSANAASSQVTINGHSYAVELVDNRSSRAFAKQMPITMTMKELNGNEKYHYLPHKLPSHDQAVHQIHAGDVMLYQSRCIVLFYKNFKTSYSYTKLGHLQNFARYAHSLGSGSIQAKWTNQ